MVTGVPGAAGGVVSAWVVAAAWLLAGETLPEPSERGHRVAVLGSRREPAVGVGRGAAVHRRHRGRAAVDGVPGDAHVVGRRLPGQRDGGRSCRGRGEVAGGGRRRAVRGSAVDVHAGPGGVPGQVAGRDLVGVSRSRGGRLVRVAGHGGRDGRQVGAVAVDVVGRDPDVVRRRGPGEDVLRGTSGRFEAAGRRGRRAVRREVVGLRVEGPAAGVDRRDRHRGAADSDLQEVVHLRVAARGGGRAARRPLGAAVGPAHRVGVGGAALADRLRRGAAVAGDIIGYPARRGDVPLVDVRVPVERQAHAVARQQLARGCPSLPGRLSR